MTQEILPTQKEYTESENEESTCKNTGIIYYILLPIVVFILTFMITKNTMGSATVAEICLGMSLGRIYVNKKRR